MRVFITGDRQDADVTSLGQVAIELLKAAGRGDAVSTGDNEGIESLVRRVSDETGFPVEVLESPRLGSDSEFSGYVDWDTRHQLIKDMDSRVVVIHQSPSNSRILSSLDRVFADDEAERVSLARNERR